MRSRNRLRSRRGSADDGAALVEFALIALPLFLILFAIIEFGWAFFQLNDVRHGAREGLRLVAVDEDPTPANGSPSDQGDRLAQEACERMDRPAGVNIKISVTDRDGNGEFDVGDDATLTASKELDQMTQAFSAVLDSVTLDETITTRLEQDPDGSVADGVDWDCAT